MFLSKRLERNQRIAGGWLPGVQALQSPAPGPPLRGTLSCGGSSHPARAVQLIASASAPLPLAGQFWESLLCWTKENAPGASSRRNWFWNDGRMRPIPPIRGKWPKAKRGRDHPPLRKEQKPKHKKWERPEWPLPLFVFRTGAEAKRSFAQSSLPSFLSRKRD